MIDVLDNKGNKTGKTLSIDEAARKGVWHNSVSIVLVTSDHKIVVQKRSSSMLTNPNRLEITAGGFVDANESCIDAILREVKEETGVSLKPDNIVLTNRYRWNSYKKSVKRYSRCFLYSYIGFLDEASPSYKLQDNEVSSIYELNIKQANKLVNRHKLKGYGELATGYAHWHNSVQTASVYMAPEIHFICRGNTFRSRLAESLLKKKGYKKVISSGIQAEHNKNGNIAPATANLTLKNKLNKYRKYTWTQTSQNLLNRSTKVIFMSPTILEDAKQEYNLDEINYEVWNIPDIKDHTLSNAKEKSYEIFELIKSNVNGLRLRG